MRRRCLLRFCGVATSSSRWGGVASCQRYLQAFFKSGLGGRDLRACAHKKETVVHSCVCCTVTCHASGYSTSNAFNSLRVIHTLKPQAERSGGVAVALNLIAAMAMAPHACCSPDECFCRQIDRPWDDWMWEKQCQFVRMWHKRRHVRGCLRRIALLTHTLFTTLACLPTP